MRRPISQRFAAHKPVTIGGILILIHIHNHILNPRRHRHHHHHVSYGVANHLGCGLLCCACPSSWPYPYGSSQTRYCARLCKKCLGRGIRSLIFAAFLGSGFWNPWNRTSLWSMDGLCCDVDWRCGRVMGAWELGKSRPAFARND